MSTERDKNGIPLEFIKFNEEKNLNTGQEKITIGAVRAIHKTIQNDDEFILGAGSVPGHIGVSKTTDTLEA